jgi:hypothetical protein
VSSWLNNNIAPEVAGYLFNIKITSLPERIGVFQRDSSVDLEIDYDLLEQQLEETPQIIAFYDLLLAEQKAVVASLERQEEILRGTIAEAILKNARDGNYEVRRSDLENLVDADDELIALAAKAIFATKIENKLRAVVNGLNAKVDNLRSLAGFKKQEKQNP